VSELAGKSFSHEEVCEEILHYEREASRTPTARSNSDHVFEVGGLIHVEWSGAEAVLP
jgi:hypothetical protein